MGIKETVDMFTDGGELTADNEKLKSVRVQSTQPLPAADAIDALRYFNPDGVMRMGQDEVVEVRVGDQWIKARELIGLPNSSIPNPWCDSPNFSTQNVIDSIDCYSTSPYSAKVPKFSQSESWEDRWLKTIQKYRDKLRGLDLNEHYKVLVEAYREFQKDLLSLKYDLEGSRQ